MEELKNETTVFETEKAVPVSTESKNDAVPVNIYPETNLLVSLASGLTYVTPDCVIAPTLIDSYLRLLDNAYAFQQKSQFTTAFIIGFCINNIELIYLSRSDEKGLERNKKLLKEKYNLSNKQASIFKDIYYFFAEDYTKTGRFALLEEFEGYTLSKLVELIVVVKSYPKDLDKFNPKMTVKQIREKKQELYGNFKTRRVDVEKSCENYIPSSLFEQTICISETDSVNAETLEKCLNEFRKTHPEYRGTLKLMFCECENTEE